MFTDLVKYTAPLMLLFTILNFTGIVPATISLASQQAADVCCCGDGEGSEGEAPVDAEPCAEAECRCFSCAVPTLLSFDIELITLPASEASGWAATFVSSGYINAIEYPPEHS